MRQRSRGGKKFLQRDFKAYRGRSLSSRQSYRRRPAIHRGYRGSRARRGREGGREGRGSGDGSGWNGRGRKGRGVGPRKMCTVLRGTTVDVANNMNGNGASQRVPTTRTTPCTRHISSSSPNILYVPSRVVDYYVLCGVWVATPR